MTTRNDISAWIKRAPRGTTHMIVACDTLDWEDFPVYVKPGEDARKIAKSQEKVMEVYDLRKPIEPQLAADRAFNY